jgi:thioredoxin reductase
VKRIAILGAGPIGLEAALYARALGYQVSVHERGLPGAHVRRWGFLRLFSPWRLNVSSLGLAELGRQGAALPDLDDVPTGDELVARYLEPLAASLGPALRCGTSVVAVSRRGLLKGDAIGSRRRARTPFRLLLEGAGGKEEEAFADIVLDASGVYATAAKVGDGGVPAVGERRHAASIEHHVADVLGRDRARFAGKETLLVGAGFSAATMLDGLVRLASSAPGTRVVWARRAPGPDPFPVFDRDPLPERARLGREGNRLAAEPPACLTALSGVTVEAVAASGSRLQVALRPVDGGGMPETVTVDRILACVGYRPDASLYEELQVHECYASEGPMSLAAALLGQAGGDCLSRGGFGAEAMRTPEPGFFIIGQKSFGRRNDFLLQAGREQIRDVFRLLREDPALDLYRESAGAESPAGST